MASMELAWQECHGSKAIFPAGRRRDLMCDGGSGLSIPISLLLDAAASRSPIYTAPGDTLTLGASGFPGQRVCPHAPSLPICKSTRSLSLLKAALLGPPLWRHQTLPFPCCDACPHLVFPAPDRVTFPYYVLLASPPGTDNRVPNPACTSASPEELVPPLALPEWLVGD